MMKPKLNPEIIDDDNPEWTEADFAKARPASEVLPQLFATPKRGRPIMSDKKIHLSIRLDKDIVMAFRAKGENWQTQINDALRQFLRQTSSDNPSRLIRPLNISAIPSQPPTAKKSAPVAVRRKAAKKKVTRKKP